MFTIPFSELSPSLPKAMPGEVVPAAPCEDSCGPVLVIWRAWDSPGELWFGEPPDNPASYWGVKAGEPCTARCSACLALSWETQEPKVVRRRNAEPELEQRRERAMMQLFCH